MALRVISLSLYVSLAVDETPQASALPMQVSSNHFLDWWNGSKHTFTLTRVHVLFRKEAFWWSVSVSAVQTETCVFLFQPQTQRILQNMRSPRKKGWEPRHQNGSFSFIYHTMNPDLSRAWSDEAPTAENKACHQENAFYSCTYHLFLFFYILCFYFVIRHRFGIFSVSHFCPHGVMF